MSFLNDVQAKLATGLTPAAPAGALTDSDADVLADLGIDPNALLNMGTGAQQGPLMGNDLLSALIGSAMDVTGRAGQTGRPSTQKDLPAWAQGLSQQIYESPDFDPYFGSVSQQGDERVYMGKTEVSSPAATPSNKFAGDLGPASPEVDTTPGDKTLTAVQASNLPYTWDQDEVREAMEKMQAAGLLDNTATFDDLVQAWGGLVNRAATTYAMSEGKRKLTPWDVLDLYKNEAKQSGLLDRLNGSRTTVSRNVTEIDEGEAWASIQNTVSNLLGRDPSDQETRDFTYRMGQLAARNPSISRTVTQYKNGEAVSSDTRTTPGFTAADMAHEAYDRAQNDPEYGEYRAASFYFNSLLSALGPLGG